MTALRLSPIVIILGAAVWACPCQRPPPSRDAGTVVVAESTVTVPLHGRVGFNLPDGGVAWSIDGRPPVGFGVDTDTGCWQANDECRVVTCCQGECKEPRVACPKPVGLPVVGGVFPPGTRAIISFPRDAGPVLLREPANP